MNAKDPLWLNTLLLITTFLTLGLVLISAYKGWKENRALHYSGPAGHSGVIADITLNLSGIPHQEHCLTCHFDGKTVKVSGRDLAFHKDHPQLYKVFCQERVRSSRKNIFNISPREERQDDHHGNREFSFFLDTGNQPLLPFLFFELLLGSDADIFLYHEGFLI